MFQRIENVGSVQDLQLDSHWMCKNASILQSAGSFENIQYGGGGTYNIQQTWHICSVA